MFREKKIIEAIENKNVLDIGSVGQTNTYSLWNLYKSSKYKSLTGIDLPEAEETATSLFNVEYNSTKRDTKIVFGNMEDYVFENKFDVIIAGDVLEHVENQGKFLRNILNHLEEKGKLILTTPNSKSFSGLLKPNPTHILWHDKYTLFCLLNKVGFKVDYFSYYLGNKKSYSPLIFPFVYRQGLFVVCSKQ